MELFTAICRSHANLGSAFIYISYSVSSQMILNKNSKPHGSLEKISFRGPMFTAMRHNIKRLANSFLSAHEARHRLCKGFRLLEVLSFLIL